MKRYIDENPPANDDEIAMICYAFEQAVFEVLIHKLFLASEMYSVSQILLAGGVSASNTLKNAILQEANIRNIDFLAPTKNIYSGDNAAMIGIRAFYEISEKKS